MPVVSVADLFQNWRMRLLLYGRSGVGKTYLAGTAVLVKELCPIYWFAAERGMLSVRSLMETGRVEVMLAKSEADLVALQNIVSNPGPFKTVILDSLSELHALIMQVAQGKSGDGAPSRNAYREGHDKILKLLRYIDRFSSVHVIATANDLPLIDGETGRVLSMDPDMAGKLSFRATRYFDGVYYLSARSEASILPNKPPTVTRWIQTQNYDGVSAKDRSGGALGNTLMNPTMAKIYEALVGPCSELPMERVDDPSVNVAALEKGGHT